MKIASFLFIHCLFLQQRRDVGALWHSGWHQKGEGKSVPRGWSQAGELSRSSRGLTPYWGAERKGEPLGGLAAFHSGGRGQEERHCADAAAAPAEKGGGARSARPPGRFRGQVFPHPLPFDNNAGYRGAAGRLRGGAGGPGPGPVLRYGPGGLRGAGGARGPARRSRRSEPLVPRQALAGRGPEAAAGSGRGAALVRPGGRGAGALPPR